MKLTLGGITIDVNPADAQRYLRAGYVRATEEPVERPAALEPEPEVIEPKAHKQAKKKG